jgi:phage terminase small subunit
MPELITTLRPSAKWAEGLADKERVFVEEYLIDLNGRQAGIRCGYQPGNASNEARRMLDKPAVAAAIDKALAERPGISRTRIIDELAKVAFANMGDYAKWHKDGVDLIDSEDLEPEQRTAVAEVKQTRTETERSTTVTVNFKLHDKIGALEKLGKVLRMFVDRQEISGPDGEPVQIEAVRERVIGRLETLRKRMEESAKLAADNAVAIEAPAEVVAETIEGGV